MQRRRIARWRVSVCTGRSVVPKARNTGLAGQNHAASGAAIEGALFKGSRQAIDTAPSEA